MPKKTPATQPAAKTSMTIETLRSTTRVSITRSECAELFGVDPRSVSRAIAAGDIPAVRFGRSIRIPREPLLAILSAAGEQGVAL